MRVRSALTMAAAALVTTLSAVSVGPAWAVPAVTVTVNQAAGQADPTSDSTVTFEAVFSEAVTGFTSVDVTLSGTAGATAVVVTGGSTTYTITVSGMTQSGTVIVSIPGGAAFNIGSVPSEASTSADNTVSWSLASDDADASETSASEPPAIPAWVQAYGRAGKDAACLEGWDASWQEWAQKVTGGWVCTRSIPSLG